MRCVERPTLLVLEPRSGRDPPDGAKVPDVRNRHGQPRVVHAHQSEAVEHVPRIHKVLEDIGAQDEVERSLEMSDGGLDRLGVHSVVHPFSLRRARRVDLNAHDGGRPPLADPLSGGPGTASDVEDATVWWAYPLKERGPIDRIVTVIFGSECYRQALWTVRYGRSGFGVARSITDVDAPASPTNTGTSSGVAVWRRWLSRDTLPPV